MSVHPICVSFERRGASLPAALAGAISIVPVASSSSPTTAGASAPATATRVSMSSSSAGRIGATACRNRRADDRPTHGSFLKLFGALHVSIPLSVVKKTCCGLTSVTIAFLASSSTHTTLLSQVAGFLTLLRMRTRSPMAKPCVACLLCGVGASAAWARVVAYRVVEVRFAGVLLQA
ncbi:hypothetical protein MHU86_15678 [Fragilaria crotonensis]|nr:hypothetical protein MHU86_15678 [Fragilaria crotonensis]